MQNPSSLTERARRIGERRALAYFNSAASEKSRESQRQINADVNRSEETFGPHGCPLIQPLLSAAFISGLTFFCLAIGWPLENYLNQKLSRTFELAGFHTQES